MELLAEDLAHTAARVRRGSNSVASRAEIQLLIDVVGRASGLLLDALPERTQAALERFRDRQTCRFADLTEDCLRLVIEPDGPNRHACTRLYYIMYYSLSSSSHSAVAARLTRYL